MFEKEGERISELIGEYFDAASDLPVEERSRFLDSRLDSSRELDRHIRSEVERLLRGHERAGPLDDTLINAASLQEQPLTALGPGEIVSGRFRIQKLIGRGGMGEVYQAEDMRVGETIALKTMRGDIAADRALAARFRRELLIARNLAHRNLCKVFEYDEIDRGPKGLLHIFTMELLHGETLAQRLATKGRFSPQSALAILGQVAAGMEEVHRSGIIHRDLKPSNIFLVREPDGTERAVVMDFGLARNVTDDSLDQTRTGMAMGTRLYMAPEIPKSAGVNSDIYSFGVIALEIVTGSPSPIVAPRSILPSLAASWDKAILQCCNLDPAKRPASTLEVVAMLRARPNYRRRAVMAAGIAAACATGAFAAWKIVAFLPVTGSTPTQITFDAGVTVNPSSSADGKLLAYATDRGSAGDLNIWLQDMETGTAQQISNSPYDDDEPTLSRDGKLIAWRTGQNRNLYVRPADGGEARAIAERVLAPRFSPDGRFIAYWTGVDGERNASASAWVVPAEGGTPRNIAPGFYDARIPEWSPDGKSILFRGVRAPTASLEEGQEWWITSIDGKTARATGIGAKIRNRGLQIHDSPTLWADNRMVFAARVAHGINLHSVTLYPFFNLTSPPVAVTVSPGLQYGPTTLSGGRLAFADFRERIHVFRLDIASGTMDRITDGELLDTRVSSSIDGQVLVFGRREGKIRRVFIKDRQTGEERLLLDKELAIPFVSPDGKTVAISAGASLRLIDVATARQSLVCDDCGELLGWMPNSRGLVYRANKPGVSPSIRVLDLENKASRSLLSASGLDEAAVAPGGKTLAFTVRTNHVYSTIFGARLTPAGVAGNRVALTDEDAWAGKPVWSGDGKTLYFESDRDGFQCIWARAIDTVHLRATSNPRALAHFHKAAFTLSHLSPASFGLAFSNDGLFLSVSQSESNIWAVRW